MNTESLGSLEPSKRDEGIEDIKSYMSGSRLQDFIKGLGNAKCSFCLNE